MKHDKKPDLLDYLLALAFVVILLASHSLVYHSQPGSNVDCDNPEDDEFYLCKD